jgi:hypothetical protein
VRAAWKLTAAVCVAAAAGFGAAQLSGGTVRSAAENRASCVLVKGSIADSLTPLSYLQLLRQLAEDGQHAADAAINSAAESLARSLPQSNTPTSYSAVNWKEANAARTELIAACNSLGIGPYESPPHT